MKKLILGDVTKQPTSFWTFVGAVTVGNVAALATSYLARAALRGRSDSTRTMATALVGTGAFWIAGGLAWALLRERET